MLRRIHCSFNFHVDLNPDLNAWVQMSKIIILSTNQPQSDHHLEIESILLLSSSTTPFGSILYFIERKGGGRKKMSFQGNFCWSKKSKPSCLILFGLVPREVGKWDFVYKNYSGDQKNTPGFMDVVRRWKQLLHNDSPSASYSCLLS